MRRGERYQEGPLMTQFAEVGLIGVRNASAILAAVPD